MMRKFILSLTLILGMASMRAAFEGDWKIYPSFDEMVGQVVATPGKVYMTGLGHPYLTTNDKYNTYADYLASLYVFDLETEEFRTLTHRDALSDVRVSKIAYNPERKYLIVIYINGNIDLIFDDGRTRNIQGLKLFTSLGSKEVCEVTFSPENNEAYLATSFGYIVIDDEDCVIKSSRILGHPIKCAARVGDAIFLTTGDDVYQASAKSTNLSLSDFTKLPDDSPVKKASQLLPMTNGKIGFYVKNKAVYAMEIDKTDPGKPTDIKVVYDLSGSGIDYFQRVDNGYFYDIGWAVGIIYDDGTIYDAIVEELKYDQKPYCTRSSFDMKTVWDLTGRKGMRQRAIDKTKNFKEWTVLHDYFFPNAPVSGLSAGGNICYNPKYGMLTANHSVLGAFLNVTYYYPALLSGYKDGRWTTYSPQYTNSEYASYLNHPRGPEVDPDNPKYVYFGSWFNGMYRLNLADSTDVLHFTHPSDSALVPDGFAKKLSGYKEIIADNPKYKGLCHFSKPRFDSKGNLWALHLNYAGADPGTKDEYDGVIWVWPSDKRKAADHTGWVRGGIKGFTVDKDAIVCPLKYGNNKNLVIFSNGRSKIYVTDTKGTPTDFSDDVSVELATIYDQDGSLVTKNNVYDFYEDPNTSLVWVATSSGVFTFNPSNIFNNPTSVRRIKVSRNDGTNLADYLLDGIAVVRILADNGGNKWFATTGAGLVETSSDGTHVIRQLLEENSYLPEDNIFDMGYNPETNSIMVSTKPAYAEYFPPGSSTGNNFDAVKIYPNPVRPDFMGWITIEGLVDNALVKIVDAAGNLVKELGHSVGGVVQWDGTNVTNAKVNSGVYYVMMSNTDSEASVANVGKLLVVK